MANLWELPTSLCVNGNEYSIRTDYRDVINLLTALSDKEMCGDTPEETNIIHAELMIQIMVINADSVLPSDFKDLVTSIRDFIDMGMTSKNTEKKQPRLMDWEQDSAIIIPAVNRVVGHEIRQDSYMHWWTFLSAYMEIGECTYSSVINLRAKKAKGKKLEKWEQEYIRDNSELIILKDKLTDAEQEERNEELDALNALLGN